MWGGCRGPFRRCRVAGIFGRFAGPREMRRFNLSLEKTPVKASIRFATFAIAALVLLSSPPARADDTWTLSAAATGDWSIAGNWSGGVPTASSTADIFDGGTATVTTTGDVCNTLSLGSTTGAGSIQMTGGGLTVSNSAFVGYSGTGYFSQSGGTNTATNNLYSRLQLR